MTKNGFEQQVQETDKEESEIGRKITLFGSSSADDSENILNKDQFVGIK